MREITLQEMRELQLAMLNRIHAFCTERGLRYSLGGGTLLGAVRHQGYIPWDDDIDIMMPRPDYERFLMEFDGQYEHLVLQHYKNDDECCIPFAKVFDQRTILVEASQRNGVYIDVFPIDGLPALDYIPAVIERFNHYVGLLQKTTKFYRFQKRHFLRIKYWVKKLYTPSRQTIIQQFDDFLQTYDFDTAENAGAIVGVYAEKEAMSAEVFRNYTVLPFEGHEYQAISDYDAYLTQHYGDYMQLPPDSEQRSHHVFEAYWKD